MADTSNLSQFLTDIADAIRTKKETTEPIAAEQFDQEILSIETGSGDIPVKLFETINEMQADPDANEGDLALVYRNESLPMTSSSVFTTVTFPDTVVFDTAITSSSSGYLYDENRDHKTQCQLRYSSTYFYIRDYYTYKYIVRYTSTDGITYTLDSGYETSYTFEQPMHFEGTWKDAYGQFIYCGGQYFEGLFEYKNVVSNHIVEFYKGLNIIKPDGTTGVNWTDQKNIDVKNLMTVLDKIIADLNYTYIRANVEYVSDDEFILYVCNDDSNTYLYNSYLGRATGLYLMTGNQKSATQFKKIVVNTIDLTYNISTLSVSGTVLNGLDYLVELNDDHYYTIIDYRDYAISLSNIPEVNIQQLKDGRVISQQKLTVMGYEDTYVIAQTQLTINNKNQLLPGVVAYGNKGIIEGDGSIYNVLDTKNVVDMLGMNELYSVSSYFSSFKLTVDKNKLYSVVEDNTSNYVFNHPYNVKELGYPTSTDYFKNLLNLQYINAFAVFSLNDFYTGMLAICSATSTSVTSGGDLIYVIFDPDFNIVKTETIVANTAIPSTSVSKEICYSPTDCYVTFKSPFDTYKIFTFKFDMTTKTLDNYALYNCYSNSSTTASYIKTVYHNNYLYVARSVQYSSTYYLYVTKFNPDLTVVKNTSYSKSTIKDIRLTDFITLDGDLYLRSTGYASSTYYNCIFKIEDTINTVIINTTDKSQYDGIFTDGEYLYVGCEEGTNKYNSALQLIETLPIKSTYYSNVKYFNFNITDYANYTCESFQRRLSVVNGKVQDTTYYDPSNPFMDTKKSVDLYVVGSMYMNSDFRIVNKMEIGKSSVSKSAWLILAPKVNASFKEGLYDNAYMIGISDGEKIYYTAKFNNNAMKDYTGTISPVEYDTALETAQDILGKEVTE